MLLSILDSWHVQMCSSVQYSHQDLHDQGVAPQQVPVEVIDGIDETCATPGHVTHVNAILPGIARAQVQIRFASRLRFET